MSFREICCLTFKSKLLKNNNKGFDKPFRLNSMDLRFCSVAASSGLALCDVTRSSNESGVVSPSLSKTFSTRDYAKFGLHIYMNMYVKSLKQYRSIHIYNISKYKFCHVFVNHMEFNTVDFLNIDLHHYMDTNAI